MSWEDVLKAPIDLKWLELINGIKNDAMPKDRNKYVRYSNLDKINRNMVNYYFRIGKNKKKRQSAINGILEEMLRSSNARYDIEDKGGEDIVRSLKKKQTTLHGFDPKLVESLIEPDKSNIWIAPIKDPKIPNEEKSKLSDKMLDELARLNVGNKFTITSATGKTPDIWGTEPSFMLTGVPTSLESKIYEMADKYGQDAIAVSARGEKGAKFITPKGKVTWEFEDMEFDQDATHSTDFPSGQRLTFKSLDKWKEVLKWAPPSSWSTFKYKDTAKEKREDDLGYGNIEAGSGESPSVIVRPHYMYRGDERGGPPNETEMPQWIEKLGSLSKCSYWFWRFPDTSNLQMVLVQFLNTGDTLPSSEHSQKKPPTRVDKKTLIFNTIYPKDGRQPPKDNVIPKDIWNAGEGFEDRGQNKAREDKDLTTPLKEQQEQAQYARDIAERERKQKDKEKRKRDYQRRQRNKRYRR